MTGQRLKEIVWDTGAGFMWIVITLCLALLVWICLLAASYAIVWASGEIQHTFEFWEVLNLNAVLLVAGTGIGCWFLGSTIRQCQQIDTDKQKRRDRDHVRLEGTDGLGNHP